MDEKLIAQKPLILEAVLELYDDTATEYVCLLKL